MRFAVRYMMWIIISYLSGNVMYGYLVPMKVKKIDVIKMSEDGNPGTYNAFRLAGIWCGSTVLICELLKGFLPVALAGYILGTDRLFFACIMAAPVLGHIYPLKNKGGKGIAVSFGVLLGLFPLHIFEPVLILACLYILTSTVVRIKDHGKRSIFSFAIFGALSLIMVDELTIKLGCMLVAALVVTRHISGNERKYEFRK